MSSNQFPWVSHHGMTSEQYQSYFNQYIGQGYGLAWVSGYSLNGDDRYAAVWYNDNGPQFVAHHRMTSSQYQSYFDQYVSQGYRLIEVSGYAFGNEANYAALWQRAPGADWVAHHGMTSEQYQSYFDLYISQGYVLKQVDGYTVNRVDYYAAIWTKDTVPAFVAHHRMTSSQYQSYFDQYVGQGYRLVDVSGYTVDGVANYAALWYKDNGPAFVARHGLDAQQYQAAFDDYVNQGYRLTVVDGYEVGGVDYYAAIWTK